MPLNKIYEAIVDSPDAQDTAEVDAVSAVATLQGLMDVFHMQPNQIKDQLADAAETPIYQTADGEYVRFTKEEMLALAQASITFVKRTLMQCLAQMERTL